jgi:Fe-S-cluster containining protein
MSGNLCEHCVGYCCRHIALPLDEPEERSDFDDIRWYLLHEGVTVFVEDGDWYIHVQTTCRHLQPDYRCGIYETRPQICRDYSTDNCDYHSGDYGWEQHFTAAEHLDAYVEERFRKRGAQKSRKKSGSSRNGKQGKGKTRKPGRSGVRVRLKRRQNPERRYTDTDTDRAGVKLPVLGMLR